MPYKQARAKPTGVPGIRKDGPKRFLVRVRWNDPRTGRRRKREAVANSLAKAVALRETLKGGNLIPKPTRQRFSDYAEQWMQVHSPRLALSTATPDEKEIHFGADCEIHQNCIRETPREEGIGVELGDGHGAVA